LGACVLSWWQKVIADQGLNDLHLWRDHLPKLLMSSPYDFYLVRDAAIIPKRGFKIDIPIKNLANLPKGKEFYKFPLTQGESQNQLDYNIYLKSSDFPLKKDAKYMLSLTYKYGEDDPYELYFIPNAKKTSLSPIKAEWRDREDFRSEDLISPDFPKKKDWDQDEFKYFENRFDLIEKLSERLNSFSYLLGIAKDVNRELNYIDWVNKEKGFLFTENRIWCHKSRFINLKNEDKRQTQFEDSLSVIKESENLNRENLIQLINCYVNIANADEFIHENEVMLIQNAIENWELKISVNKPKSGNKLELKE